MGIDHFSVSDLAPGDQKDTRSTSFDWQAFQLTKVTSSKDPLFEEVFRRFWQEFGSKAEIEQKEVLIERLRWKPSTGNRSFGYEMLVVQKDKSWVAARDHTAIIIRTPQPQAIVHLSHVLIEPEFRGTGLAGWLRAFPVQKARACLKEAGCLETAPITLVAEMEPLGDKNSAQEVRLRSYQRAGFKMLDPQKLQYLQPDFRAFANIDASGGARPLRLNLLIRQVGREQEAHVSPEKAQHLVTALYEMYGMTFRKKDMDAVWRAWQSQSFHSPIALIDPL